MKKAQPAAAQPNWPEQVQAVAQRYNHEFSGQPFDLPPEVEEMPVFPRLGQRFPDSSHRHALLGSGQTQKSESIV